MLSQGFNWESSKKGGCLLSVLCAFVWVKIKELGGENVKPETAKQGKRKEK